MSLTFASYKRIGVPGYRLCRENRFEQAVEIFKLNIEEYPDSPDVYYGLGEAYKTNGQREPAGKYFQMAYDKAREVNRHDLEFFKTALKRMKSGLDDSPGN